MVDRVGEQRADDAHVVSALRGQLGPDHADRLSRVPPLAKVVLGRKDPQRRPLQLGDLLPLGHRRGHRLVGKLFQERLVIERIEMAHPTGHVEPDDPLGFRDEMRIGETPRPAGRLDRLRPGRGLRRAQKGAQRHRAKAQTGVGHKGAASNLRRKKHRALSQARAD